jgi:hypothetical protein
LLIEQQVKQFNALHEWFQTALGLSVAEEFRKQLLPVLEYLKGDTLLQLGHCANNLWLDDLHFKNKWIASPFLSNKKNTIVCSLSQIPSQRNSIDCIIAPLTLEPFLNSFTLFDEIDRVLKPMGYVVFLGLNPWSVWSGALKCGWLHCYAEKKIKLHNSFHLNRVLGQRGYRQCALNHFYFIPPFNNTALLKKLTFFNVVGKMLWPFPSGFYCYIAQKYEPISPSLLLDSSIQRLPNEYLSSLQATN